MFVFDELGQEFFVARGEDLQSEKARIASAADCDGSDRDTAGHLNN